MGRMKDVMIRLYNMSQQEREELHQMWRAAANHDPSLDLRLVGSLSISAPLNNSGSCGKRVSDPSLSLPSHKSDEACGISSSSNNSVTTAPPSEHGGPIPDSEQGTCQHCEYLMALCADDEVVDEIYCHECGV